MRFIDIDEDGNEDIVFSNEKEYGVYLFTDMEHGWSKKVIAGKAGDEGALPPIAINGKNNGFFVHSRSLWWQNENTALLRDHVDRRSFNDLLDEGRAGRQIAAGVAALSAAAARLPGGAGRRRAAGAEPDRVRLGTGRQALGRRDGRLSARHRRQGQARRPHQVPRRDQRRRQIRQGDGLSRRPRLPDRRAAVAQGRAGRLRSGHLLRRGHRRRRQGRQ